VEHVGRDRVLHVAHDREGVEEEVDLIGVIDAGLDELGGARGQRVGAAEEQWRGGVVEHGEAVRRRLDAVAEEELAEALRSVPRTVLRGAEGKGVVRVGELGGRRGQGVHLGGKGVARAVPLRIATREVECGGRRVAGMDEEYE